MSSHVWFRKSLVEPGAVVSFSLPSPTRWKIIEQVSELEHQMEESAVKSGSSSSYAALKLLCHNIRPTLQKELEGLRAMTEKGSTITPQLLAYSEGRQDQSGWVPGGVYHLYCVGGCPGGSTWRSGGRGCVLGATTE